MGVKVLGGIQFIGMAEPGTPPSPAGQVSPAANGGIVEFDRDEFAALIQGKGYALTWERSAWCPNRRGASPDAHDFTCTVCDGTGFLYYGALPTKMLVTSAKVTQQFYAYGRWDAGTVYVTAMPEHKISYWDRLTLTDTELRFSELVTRATGTKIDRLKYSATSLDFVAWVGRNGALKVYKVGVDVKVTTDGRLQWLTAGQPDDRSQFTVSYSYQPRYVVLDLLHQHRESPVGGVQYEFPVQAMAKLDFLVRDEGKDGATAQNPNPFTGN